MPTVKDYFLFSSIVLNKIFKPFQYPTRFFNTDICEVDCVQGCLFMLNNSLIEDKLYDENIFLFFEESCIGKQFKDKGYKTKLLMNVDLFIIILYRLIRPLTRKLVSVRLHWIASIRILKTIILYLDSQKELCGFIKNLFILKITYY